MVVFKKPKRHNCMQYMSKSAIFNQLYNKNDKRMHRSIHPLSIQLILWGSRAAGASPSRHLMRGCQCIPGPTCRDKTLFTLTFPPIQNLESPIKGGCGWGGVEWSSSDLKVSSSIPSLPKKNKSACRSVLEQDAEPRIVPHRTTKCC